jgi:acyl-CoA dehydrogenase
MTRPPPVADAAAAQDPAALSRTLASRLGAGRAELDEKAYADAILAQLRADRLLWPATPGSGGRTLGVLDCARITADVARLSGSAGLIYAMHLSQAFSLVRHAGDSGFLRALWERLAEDQALVASGTSEKGVGGDIYGSLCAVEDAGDGRLSLTKESPNISYLDHAAAVLVSALRPQGEGRKTQVLIAVAREDLDLQPAPAAGFLGMRGILNRPYRFTARFAEAAIFPEPYPAIARATMTPTVHIFWAALWSGIARRVIDTVKAFQAKAAASADETAVVMRADLSRLVDKQHLLTSLIRDAIAAYEAPVAAGASGGVDLKGTARIKRLKVTASELLEQICLGGLALIGLPAYAEDGPFSLSEPLRDALSARVMISNYRLTSANAKIERYIDEDL